jgi:hypothetical protein
MARTFVGGFGYKPGKKILNGTIRENFEEADDDEKLVTPGPGGCLKPYHTDMMGKSPINHKHP